MPMDADADGQRLYRLQQPTRLIWGNNARAHLSKDLPPQAGQGALLWDIDVHGLISPANRWAYSLKTQL
jgi:hypothetical protein